MTRHDVLDKYYLSLTLLVTIGYQLLFFSVAYTLQIDKLTDFAGGTNFVLLALLTLGLSPGRSNARNIVASTFLAVTAARLAGFLLFRILKTGTDHRFDEMRGKLISFLGFWTLQALWVWGVSLPITVLNSPGVMRYGEPKFGTGRDIAGVIFFAIGLFMESVSDAQRYRFREKHGNTGLPCTSGFWSLTRHPNYFGEITCHWGIYMICVSPAAYGYTKGGAHAALYATILGPFWLTFLFLFVSGINLSERPSAKKRYEKGDHWAEYSRYLERTSVFIPFPPQLYARMPVILKRTLFLEFPMYVFDPAKHSDKTPREVEQDREQLRNESV